MNLYPYSYSKNNPNTLTHSHALFYGFKQALIRDTLEDT